jgi:hypothetical protein
MAGCEESQGQELLLIYDGLCFLFEFEEILEWHWAGFLSFFSPSCPLCFSLLSSRTKTRPKETETGRIDHRLEALVSSRFNIFTF